MLNGQDEWGGGGGREGRCRMDEEEDYKQKENKGVIIIENEARLALCMYEPYTWRRWRNSENRKSRHEYLPPTIQIYKESAP